MNVFTRGFLSIMTVASIIFSNASAIPVKAEEKEKRILDIPVVYKVKEIDVMIPAKDLVPAEDTYISQEEIDLLATVVMAEAEGETELGQRLVIDTVFNRKDSPYFPNTVSEVLRQPYQYTSEGSKRFSVCYPKEEIIELIYEELEHRTNSEVVFFRTGRYSDYGTPAFKECCHYFSTM